MPSSERDMIYRGVRFSQELHVMGEEKIVKIVLHTSLDFAIVLEYIDTFSKSPPKKVTGQTRVER
jgi:hypothetical protein